MVERRPPRPSMITANPPEHSRLRGAAKGAFLPAQHRGAAVPGGGPGRRAPRVPRSGRHGRCHGGTCRSPAPDRDRRTARRSGVRTGTEFRRMVADDDRLRRSRPADPRPSTEPRPPSRGRRHTSPELGQHPPGLPGRRRPVAAHGTPRRRRSRHRRTRSHGHPSARGWARHDHESDRQRRCSLCSTTRPRWNACGRPHPRGTRGRGDAALRHAHPADPRQVMAEVEVDGAQSSGRAKTSWCCWALPTTTPPASPSRTASTWPAGQRASVLRLGHPLLPRRPPRPP